MISTFAALQELEMFDLFKKMNCDVTPMVANCHEIELTAHWSAHGSHKMKSTQKLYC